jgi:hypothetical protein
MNVLVLADRFIPPPPPLTEELPCFPLADESYFSGLPPSLLITDTPLSKKPGLLPLFTAGLVGRLWSSSTFDKSEIEFPPAVAVQVDPFEKSKPLKPVFHFKGSRVETRCAFKLWVNYCIQLV